MLNAIRSAYYRLPDGLQRAILVKRRERAWIEAGILFIHIPKAAGTSISEALYGRFMGHVHASDIERWGSSRLKSLPSFAVTRNPWDRLVSAYRYSRRLHTVDWEANLKVPKVIRAQVPQYETFERFVREWLAPRDITTLNPIFQPQSLFVYGNGKLLVDHLGRLENMARTREFLRHYLGDIGLERSNPSGTPVDYRKYYTSDLAKLVGRIYAEDVDCLAYDFDGASDSGADDGVAAIQ